MAEPRKAASPTDSCSFCGEHKTKVPLIVTSQLNSQAACCSTCALTIVHQTHSWAYGVFETVVSQHEGGQQIQKDTTDEVIARVSS